jgi:hypothetical protein
MFFTFHISISIVLTTTFSTVFLYSFDVFTRTMLKSLFTAVCTFSCIHLNTSQSLSIHVFSK